jgi:predicted aspartyl protease
LSPSRVAWINSCIADASAATEALSENLLGLSFLSKLKRFEYANGMMVLEQ